MLLSALALTGSISHGQNLLSNGDFNSAETMNTWSAWTFGGGWANREMNTVITPSLKGNYDGSYQMSLGGNANAGAGVYQTVSATAGISYTLSVDGGAQNWWLPTGQIRLFFLDGSNNQLGLTQINTTDSIHNPDKYDVGVAFQTWSLSAVAPAGTTQAKVEFAGYGGGSSWFDNASLTTAVAVPEPSSAAMMVIGSIIWMVARSRRNTRV